MLANVRDKQPSGQPFSHAHPHEAHGHLGPILFPSQINLI